MVAVIDRSGSMSGSKIELVKHTLRYLVTQLNSRDRQVLKLTHSLQYMTYSDC